MVKLPKGTRDFPPEQKILRNNIVQTLTKVFERFGYSPFETPMFELYDVLASKFTGGEEILKETFKLSDQGKRNLALRYDLTVPLARYIAMNPMMKMPFKRYHVGEVFRDGPVGTARYRQFTQCDVDVVGAKSLIVDAELISLAQMVFSELNLDVVIKVNNRKLLTELIVYGGGDAKKADDYVLSIDKLEKIGADGVSKELVDKGMDKDAITKVLDLLTLKGTSEKKMTDITAVLPDSQGLTELNEVFALLSSQDNVVFDPSLARGLAYYTGTIVEVTLKKSKVTSSICGGGRYDDMIGSLVGNKDIPAIGISFGLDRIFDALSEGQQLQKTVTKLYVASVGQDKEVGSVASTLRKAGINVEIDLMSRNPGKNIQYANAMKIPYILFVGEEEVKTKTFKLKNMETGEEKTLSIQQVISELT